MPSGPLKIEVLTGSRTGQVVLRLSGPLVLDNVFDFQKIWREEGAANIVVDLTHVPYVDSTGIGSLVNMHVSRQKIGGSVELVGVSERVKTVLQVTRVDKVLTITDSGTSTAVSA
jgi:anti-sigma B factor antagonist